MSCRNLLSLGKHVTVDVNNENNARHRDHMHENSRHGWPFTRTGHGGRCWPPCTSWCPPSATSLPSVPAESQLRPGPLQPPDAAGETQCRPRPLLGAGLASLLPPSCRPGGAVGDVRFPCRGPRKGPRGEVTRGGRGPQTTWGQGTSPVVAAEPLGQPQRGQREA